MRLINSRVDLQSIFFMFVIFLTAISLRIILIETTFQNITGFDGIKYHNIAVNVALGNGYSIEVITPYYPYFFREPGYPLFIAGIYKIWSTSFGTVNYLRDNHYNHKDYSEIVFLKYFQAVFGALTIVLFYLTIKTLLRDNISFFIALLFSLYIPLAIFSTQILRETIQTFIIVLTSYLFAKYIQTDKYRWLIIFSIFWAFSNLILQTTLLLFLFIAVFIYLSKRSIFRTIKDVSLSFIIMCIIISPWIIRSYNFYPNWRIIKSMGNSLTHEYAGYVNSLRRLTDLNLITKQERDETIRKEASDLNDRERFKRSYNGYYTSRARAINEKINEPLLSYRIFKNTLKRISISWIESLWVVTTGKAAPYIHPFYHYKVNRNYFMMLLSFGPVIFGYLAIPSIYLYYKKLFPALLLFTYFLTLFYIIATEPRRMLPIHAFIYMFSCLTIFHVYLRVFFKWNTTQISNFLFKE